MHIITMLRLCIGKIQLRYLKGINTTNIHNISLLRMPFVAKAVKNMVTLNEHGINAGTCARGILIVEC